MPKLFNYFPYIHITIDLSTLYILFSFYIHIPKLYQQKKFNLLQITLQITFMYFIFSFFKVIHIKIEYHSNCKVIYCCELFFIQSRKMVKKKNFPSLSGSRELIHEYNFSFFIPFYIPLHTSDFESHSKK